MQSVTRTESTPKEPTAHCSTQYVWRPSHSALCGGRMYITVRHFQQPSLRPQIAVLVPSNCRTCQLAQRPDYERVSAVWLAVSPCTCAVAEMFCNTWGPLAAAPQPCTRVQSQHKIARSSTWGYIVTLDVLIYVGLEKQYCVQRYKSLECNHDCTKLRRFIGN
jgi:hypothetical protein